MTTATVINLEQSTKVAARMTGYNDQYVRKLCREGKVQARLIGKTWLVDVPSLRAWLAEHHGPKPRG